MNAPNQLSFLPDDYLVRKAQHRTNVICATLFVVMIAAIAIAFTTSERRMQQAEIRHNEVDKRYIEATKPIAELNQLQDKQKVLARHAELAASLIDRVPRSYMLAEITNRLPEGVSLTDLQMTRKKQSTAAAAQTAFAKRKSSKSKPSKKEVALPPAPDKWDVDIKLSGLADSDEEVSRFMGALGDTGLFTSVELLLSAEFERSDSGLRKFNLQLALDPSADIRPAANAPGKPSKDNHPSLTQVTP